MVPLDKKQARAKGLANRKALDPTVRHAYSHTIFMQVKTMLDQAKHVGCYVSMKEEVETDEILGYCFAHDIPVSVPKVEGNDLVFYRIQSLNDVEQGYFGVKEPIVDTRTDPKDIDLMIIPLSSFDEEGHRTGYGRGFYDRYLTDSMHKVGIAYSCQRMEYIETDAWDTPLDEVMTEKTEDH